MRSCGVDRARLTAWVEAYEQAWRSPGVDALSELFAPAVTYLVEPYAEPIRGLEALARWWDGAREGPDEVFAMQAEVVAIEASTGVVRVQVAYGGPVEQEYRDLWIVVMGPDGRCTAFEEWPFWPGHGRSPSSATGLAVDKG